MGKRKARVKYSLHQRPPRQAAQKWSACSPCWRFGWQGGIWHFMHLLILIVINSLKHGVLFQLNEVTLRERKAGVLISCLNGEQAFLKMRDWGRFYQRKDVLPNPLQLPLSLVYWIKDQKGISIIFSSDTKREVWLSVHYECQLMIFPFHNSFQCLLKVQVQVLLRRCRR